MTQLEIWSMIAQSALNYIFISIISANNQKMTVTDMKTDLRTTKEDLMNELKDSRKNIIEMLELIEKQQGKEKEKWTNEQGIMMGMVMNCGLKQMILKM